MTTRIKLRRDTAANWTENNPILAAGEPGLETDTGKTKYGDGTTAWTSLSYATGGITAREQIGYFMTHGTFPNDAEFDWWFEGVETDPSGNAYYVGGYDDNNEDDSWAQVVKVNSLGEVQWQKDLTWADGWEGSAISAVYNTATSQLVVVARMYDTDNDNDLGAAVITMNAETGAVVGDPTYISDEVTSDGSQADGIDPSDIILDNDGNPIVVGQMYGAVSTYALTTTKVGVYNSIFVDPAAFTDKTPFPYNDWYITGTNITYEVDITDVNYYENEPAVAVVHTGTGATFVLGDDGEGGYTITNPPATGGSNYRVGNKIRVLGSELGGSDGTNDATITITEVDGGSVTIATISGVAFATAPGGGWTVTGTNIVSGSSATFNSRWRLTNDRLVYFPDNAATFGASWYQQGSGFAVGDTLYLNPDQYGGSTSATITVTSIGGGGEIGAFTFTGTFNTSTIKLSVGGGGTDFSTEGSWIAVNRSTEAFIWTQDWAKKFGENEFDKVNAAAKDSEGNIYLACTSYDETVEGPFGFGFPMSMLVKLDSAGNKEWAKRFAFVPLPWADGGYSGIAVDSNDDIIVAESNLITKVDSDGTVLWQKSIGLDESGLPMWNVCVDTDSDDNIYLASEYDPNGAIDDSFLIIKFDSDGVVIWQREAGTINEDDSNWDNGFQILSVANDRVNIAGSFAVDEGDSVALAVSFPTDGSGVDPNRGGNFILNTVDVVVTATTATVYDYTSLIVAAAQVTVTTATTIIASTSTTTNASIGIRIGDVDGRIENLYSLSFEDGTVQTTAYTGALTRAENRVYNTNDIYLNLSHANKFVRWDADGWSDTVEVFVPHNDDVPFPIGTQIHFVKERGIYSFMFWPWSDVSDEDDIVIMPSSPADGMEDYAYNTGEGWSVRNSDGDKIPARITLTKVDTNQWLLECSSTRHVMDWSW